MESREPTGQPVDDDATEAVDPLDAILEQLSPAGVGELLGVAAAFHLDDPAHELAWDEVHAAAGSEGLEPEIARIRGRVAQWATQGSGLAVGHLGVDVGDDQRRIARMAVADAVVDACVAFMLGDRLDPSSSRVLLRPWGLPEEDDTDEGGGDDPDTDGPPAG